MAFPLILAGVIAGGVIWEIARPASPAISPAVAHPANADRLPVVGVPAPNAGADASIDPTRVGAAAASATDQSRTDTLVSDGLGVVAPPETLGGKLSGVGSATNMPGTSTAPVTGTLSGATAVQPATPTPTLADPFGLGKHASIPTVVFGSIRGVTPRDSGDAMKSLGPVAGAVW
jgi:hypothetical protein